MRRKYIILLILCFSVCSIKGQIKKNKVDSVFNQYKVELPQTSTAYKFFKDSLGNTNIDSKEKFYSFLWKNRIVPIFGVIDDYSCKIIGDLILLYYKENQQRKISIIINSIGGSFVSTLGIYDLIYMIGDDCEISTYAYGMAASSAAILLMAGNKDKRIADPCARILIHSPRLGEHKKIKESEDTIDINKELTSLKKEVYQIIGERTGHTIGETKKYCERETWFAAKEALDFGIINQICTWAEYSKSFVP